VSIDTPFKVPEPAAFAGANVMFEPGSRTAWRSHVRGQLLIVTSGKGRVQQWGGPVQEIQKGDVVWFPPGVKHWHGAAPDSPMTHIAIVDEGGSGDATHWMEKVTDEQ
jgi:quercetin dioxygenase-like cupin family protein